MRSDAALTPYVDDLNRILSRLMTVEALLARGKSGCGRSLRWRPKPSRGSKGGSTPCRLPYRRSTSLRFPAAMPSFRCAMSAARFAAAPNAPHCAPTKYGTDAEALMFLNRLSDYFYALGRMLTAHYEVDETLWIP